MQSAVHGIRADQLLHVFQLSDISKQLQQECAKQCSDAPLQEYAQQLASVNSLRQAAQLGPLEECAVYQQLHLASRYEMFCYNNIVWFNCH